MKQSPKITIHDYETGEASNYLPPWEVRLLSSGGVAERIGSHPGIHKVIGYISHNKTWLNRVLKGRMKRSGMSEEQIREICEKYDFRNSHELFTFNHSRKHFGNGINEPVLPSDGFLSHEAIDSMGRSEILNGVMVDIRKMLGFSLNIPNKISVIPNGESFYFDTMKAIHTAYEGLLYDSTSGKGGYHDLAILKPEHKHVCSVPLKSRVKYIYRVGMDGVLYPYKQGLIRLDTKEPVYSTDPYFVNRTDKNVFDGNQRMIFVLETEVEGEMMEYIMVAHAASLVSGIESMVNIGDEIQAGEILFKFHQGSSLSTLWPRQFFEHFKFITSLIQQTTNGNLLKVLEGQVVYTSQWRSQKIQVNSKTVFNPFEEGGVLQHFSSNLAHFAALVSQI